MSEKYETHVKAILSECPDADPKEIAEAFAKYETEFYIPPQDAMRSILRRFKGEKSVPNLFSKICSLIKDFLFALHNKTIICACKSVGNPG